MSEAVALAVTLDALFDQLEQALRDQNRADAENLIRQIESRLFVGTDDLQSAAQRLKLLKARWLEAEPSRDLDLSIGGESGLVRTENFDFTIAPPLRDGGGKKSDGVDFPVFFATNRALEGANTFSGERARDITRGRVLVHIPETHAFGETGSGFWKRLFFGDDRLKLTATDVLSRAAFLDGLRRRAQEARDNGERPDALIFLHGYNNTFEDAAIRAAQIGCDLRVAGPVGLFSWASRGSAPAYLADEATIEASESAIADFLIEFAQNCGTDRVHVIAHSMGNRGLLRALQRIFADAQRRGSLKFNQIVLAAPDVDRDLFLDLAHLYPNFAARTTLYASKADIAVNLSAKIHVAPRAGYFEPYTVAPGVDTIAVPDFDVDLLGHGYFARAEALLHDIFDLFKSGDPPNARQRIKPLATGAGWRLQK